MCVLQEKHCFPDLPDNYKKFNINIKALILLSRRGEYFWLSGKIKWFFYQHTYHHHNHHQNILPKGRSFTSNPGTKGVVLCKGRSSTANSGTKGEVLLGINRCGSFPLLSAPHSLLSTTEVRRVDLANWVLRTSPKFTTGVKYQFHQGFFNRSGPEIHITLRPQHNYTNLKFYVIFPLSIKTTYATGCKVRTSVVFNY